MERTVDLMERMTHRAFRPSEYAGQEIVLEAGDCNGVARQTRLRIRDVERGDIGSVEVSGWKLNPAGWPEGREVHFTLPVATFEARRRR